MQENLYTISAEDRLAAIGQKSAELAAAERALSEHQAATSVLRDRMKKAAIDLRVSLSGHQTNLEDVVAPTPSRPETRDTIRLDRQARTRNHAVETLKACGGALSNTQLAAYIGQDPHGLASLLEGDPRLEKYHGGRQSNEQTNWRLVETTAGAN